MHRFAIILVGLAAAPAIAAPCPAGDPPPLAAPFAAWGQATALTAATAADAAPRLSLDRATVVTLKPSADVAYPSKPGRGPRPETYGGLIVIDVPAPGFYRLAMGNYTWVDVLEDGKSLPSKAQDHSLPCVSKILDFELKAGRHLVQLADDKAATTKMMLVAGRKPPAPEPTAD